MFIFSFLSVLLQLFIYVIFAHAIMSFLIAFNVLDLRNEWVSRLWQTLSRILEPFYAPIRRFVPAVNGMDFSPLILLVIISILRMVIPI